MDEEDIDAALFLDPQKARPDGEPSPTPLPIKTPAPPTVPAAQTPAPKQQEPTPTPKPAEDLGELEEVESEEEEEEVESEEEDRKQKHRHHRRHYESEEEEEEESGDEEEEEEEPAKNPFTQPPSSAGTVPPPTQPQQPAAEESYASKRSYITRITENNKIHGIATCLEINNLYSYNTATLVEEANRMDAVFSNRHFNEFIKNTMVNGFYGMEQVSEKLPFAKSGIKLTGVSKTLETDWDAGIAPLLNIIMQKRFPNGLLGDNGEMLPTELVLVVALLGIVINSVKRNRQEFENQRKEEERYQKMWERQRGYNNANTPQQPRTTTPQQPFPAKKEEPEQITTRPPSINRARPVDLPKRSEAPRPGPQIKPSNNKNGLTQTPQQPDNNNSDDVDEFLFGLGKTPEN